MMGITEIISSTLLMPTRERDDITTGLTALRGVTGVRQYLKVNESKIPAELRAANKPKGFENEACNEDNS